MAAAVSQSTVVGVFSNRSDAQAAVRELKSIGVSDDRIGVVSKKSDGSSGADVDDGSMMGEGAAIGAATGAGVGALWALGIAAGALPAIGPVIAGGMLASVLASAAGGAAAAGLIGALIGLGIPEEDAAYYEGEVKAGRTLVTVRGGQDDARIHAILRRHAGYEMANEESTSSLKSSSTSNFAVGESCPSGTGAKMSTGAKMTTGNEATVQLKEEQLHARKENRQVGEVRIHKDVITEHKTIDVPVTREEIVIERRPASGTARSATSDMRPGEEIRIPVKEEQVKVEKTAVVKEEVTVGKRKVTETEKVAADVKHEELRVEETGRANVKGKKH